MKQKTQHDRFVNAKETFLVNDLVMIKNHRKIPGLSKGFLKKYLGPFRIKKIVSDVTFILESIEGKEEIVHYNRLTRYNVRKSIDSVIPTTRPEVVGFEPIEQTNGE